MGLGIRWLRAPFKFPPRPGTPTASAGRHFVPKPIKSDHFWRNLGEQPYQNNSAQTMGQGIRDLPASNESEDVALHVRSGAHPTLGSLPPPGYRAGSRTQCGLNVASGSSKLSGRIREPAPDLVKYTLVTSQTLPSSLLVFTARTACRRPSSYGLGFAPVPATTRTRSPRLRRLREHRARNCCTYPR